MARLEGLEPHFRANAEALVAASGGRIWFVSAVRTDAEQVVLWNRYITQGGAVAAKPRSLGGNGSKHTDGLAIDFGGDMGLLARMAPTYLMVRTVPSENWHYEPLWSRDRNQQPRYANGAAPSSPSPPNQPFPLGDTMHLFKNKNTGVWALYIPSKGFVDLPGTYGEGLVWQMALAKVPAGEIDHKTLTFLKNQAGTFALTG